MDFDERVLAELAATTRFCDVRLLAETASTSSVAAAAGRDGVVVVAEFQTAGRGRLDRRWEARPGDALLVSAALVPGLPPDRRHLVTEAAALAAREAVADRAGVVPEIKWPNDLMIGTAKLAGILAEASGEVVVVGMGMNVHGGPPGAAVLDAAAGRRVSRAGLLEAWLRGLDARARDWEAVAADYAAACSSVGRDVSVERSAGGLLRGRAVRVDAWGRLVVRTGDGSEVALPEGDVTHLR